MIKMMMMLVMMKLKMMTLMILMMVTSTSTPIVGFESLLPKSVVHVPLLLVAQHLNTRVVKIAKPARPHLVSISNILELFVRIRSLVLGGNSC